MYYDEITKTWFRNEVECYSYHTTGATWDGFNAIDDAYECGREAAAEDMIDYRDYDRMEERAGNYETGCDVLLETVYALLSGQATTRAARNALRADLEERLPACVLEERIMKTILAPERDSRGRVV